MPVCSNGRVSSLFLLSHLHVCSPAPSLRLVFAPRLHRMVLVDAPWLFKGPWELFKSLLGRHADLVHFASRQQLAQQFFTPDTVPEDFRK